MTEPTLKPARAVADVQNGMLLASVEIAAPPERVFRAIASAEVPKWWGSADTYQTTKWSGDVRVGGSWSAEGVGSDGNPFLVRGEFLEVDPPRTLIQTWCAGWDGDYPTKLTYRLETIEGGTRLTLRHEGFADRADSCRSHSEGWELILVWLQQWIARGR